MYHDQMIIERQNAVSASLPGFLSTRSPLLIEDYIERSKALPYFFVPWAPGAVIAADYLLGQAHYRPGSYRPRGWKLAWRRDFRKRVQRWHLMVRGCGPFWTVERACTGEVLVFRFGSMPILNRNYQAAMRLAEYCHPEPRGIASGSLRWIWWETAGIERC